MAQRGRPPGPGEKPWRDAIRRAVNRHVKGDGDPKALDKLADQLVAQGLTGDVSALKEIGDRLDGKPMQATEHMGEGGGPVVHRIERVIVKPSD